MILLTMSSHITQDFSTVILAKAIYVAIGFGIGQLIDNFFSQPFIFSNSVKSHPLEIFIVIISGGLLFGGRRYDCSCTDLYCTKGHWKRISFRKQNYKGINKEFIIFILNLVELNSKS